MPKVTVAIPVYNGLPYLRDAIQSVINQSYTDWVLYLINDGSTDGSLEIMYEFSVIDSRVIVIDDGLNKGLIARLNQSIEMTATEYYARMDADDIMHRTRIEEQVKFMEAHPETDVVGSSIMTIDRNNKIIGSHLSSGKVNSFIHPTVLGKTEWFSENPYCNWAVRAEDYELWCRTSPYSNFWALDTPLLFYREFGVPALNKTLLSLKMVLKIASKYKDYNRSYKWCIQTKATTICKMILYRILGVIGKIDWIIKMRRRKPIPQNKCLSEQDLITAVTNKRI